MDQEAIRQVADILARNISSAEWARLPWVILLLALASAIGVFVGKYLEAKGQHLATREDFEGIKEQLRQNTNLVEDIKAEFGYRDWAKREWVNLRRLKLEELLSKLSESEQFLDHAQHEALAGLMVLRTAMLPSDVMKTVATLYWPEIEQQVTGYCVVVSRYHLAILDLCLKIREARDASDTARMAAYGEEHKELARPMYRERLQSIAALKERARECLEGLFQTT